MRPILVALAAAVALAALVAATPAPATDCVDYTDYLHRIGDLDGLDDPVDVALAPGLACVADDTGLRILALTDPAAPRLIATYPVSGGLLRVVVHGSIACITDVAGQLHVLDLADPDDPQLLAALALPDLGRGLHREGDLLLAGCGQAGLAVVDLADPGAPQLLGTLDTPGFARGVAANGTTAVIADDEPGLQVVDLADPARPQLVGNLLTIDEAHDVVLDGEVAHVACYLYGIQLAAVTDPTAPVSLATLPLPGYALRIQVDGPTTYVISRGLHTVDTSDPLGPVEIGRNAAGIASAVAVGDGLAYLTDRVGSLAVHDAANPATPAPLAVIETVEYAFGVACVGPYTYVGAGDFFVYDHTDPAAPVLLGSVPIPGNPSRLTVADGHAYMTTAGTGGIVYAVDLADPTQPTVVGEVNLMGFPGPLAVHRGVLYVGDVLQGGLSVVDVSDPSQPVPMPTVPTGIYAVSVAADGDRLHVGTGLVGGATIETYDLADPLAPVLVDVLDTGLETIPGLVAAGDLLYFTADGNDRNGLVILDYAVPAMPVELSYLPVPATHRALVIADGHAYMSNEQSFLHVIDVADPAAPFRVGETFLPGRAFMMAASGDRIHAAATFGGLAFMPAHCDAGVSVLDPGDGDPDAPPAPPAARLSAYPNPFNPQVTLRFSLPRAETVTLDVFDLAGRRVARLLAGDPRPPGDHTVTWRPSELPSGAYLARLTTPTLVRTSKLQLVR